MTVNAELIKTGKNSMYQEFGRTGCGHLEDRECTCNVTLRRVRATIVAVEKQ